MPLFVVVLLKRTSYNYRYPMIIIKKGKEKRKTREIKVEIKR